MDASRARHLHAVDAVDLPGDDFTRSQDDLFAHLVPYVGSADALWRLDPEPLPDEPFGWSAVDDADRSFVADVLGQTDQCCDLVLDVEYRTITRRILARVAARVRARSGVARTGALRSRPGVAGLRLERHVRLPAAHARIVDLVVVRRGQLLRPGSHAAPRRRARARRRLVRRAAVPGDPTLLHSHFRETILIERHRQLEVAEERRTWSGDQGGRVTVRHLPAKVATAVKGVAEETGRALVYVGFGERIDDAHYLSLTVPEAHDLVRKVQRVLDAADAAELGLRIEHMFV